jgi:hypothetical protein
MTGTGTTTGKDDDACHRVRAVVPTTAFTGTAVREHWKAPAGVPRLQAATELSGFGSSMTGRGKAEARTLQLANRRVPSEAALLVSVSILPVPLRTYELWIDGKAIDIGKAIGVPYIPSLHTQFFDLQIRSVLLDRDRFRLRALPCA